MIDEDALKNIEKLHEMKANGILSEVEFEQAKQRLLSGATPSPTKSARTVELINRPDEQDHFAWMTLPFRQYAQFEGRSSRKEFWMFLLFTNLAGVALLSLGLMIGFAPAVVLIALALLAVIVPYIAVQVRRFHDQGKSGWFALINLVPYIGAIIVLAFMLIDGSEGDNEWGPDPKT